MCFGEVVSSEIDDTSEGGGPFFEKVLKPDSRWYGFKNNFGSWVMSLLFSFFWPSSWWLWEWGLELSVLWIFAVAVHWTLMFLGVMGVIGSLLFPILLLLSILPFPSRLFELFKAFSTWYFRQSDFVRVTLGFLILGGGGFLVYELYMRFIFPVFDWMWSSILQFQ